VHGEVKKFFDIAGTIVCLNFAGDSLVSCFFPALAHLVVGSTEKPDVVFNIWDTSSTGVEMVKPPCDWIDFTDRGDIWGFNSKRIRTAFHWSEYSVNVMDMECNTAVYWVKNPAAFPYWVGSSPLRTLIQWWMEKNGCQLLHAAAVGNENGVALIPGKGGSGKSTTALTCLSKGFQYLGDDYVIIKKEPVPVVYCLYCTAKINTADLPRFPELMEIARAPVTRNQEKAVLQLYPRYADKIRTVLLVKAILTPEISGNEETFIRSVSFWPVLQAMSFTTMSQLPGISENTYTYLKEFIRNLPCFKIMPGSDRDRIPEAIGHLLSHPECYLDLPEKMSAGNPAPLISVVIPVYNSEKFIQEAIENVLSQKYPALELIIVDDGSTDQTKLIIDKATVDIRYFYQPNEGPASARNRGIRNASGDFIAFLDSDDLWPENILYLLLDELMKDDSLEIVRGYAQLFSQTGSGPTEFLGIQKNDFHDYIGAGLYRRSVFQKVGLFDDSMKFGEDADWYNRAREINTGLKRVDIVTLYVRRHGNNMTEGKSMVELNALKVYKKALDRQRNNTKSSNEQ
jgi:hypothetical protein